MLKLFDTYRTNLNINTFFVGCVLTVLLTSAAMLPPRGSSSQLMPIPSESDDGCRIIQLEEQISLQKNQCIQIESSGYSVKILDFYNSPCPKGAVCFWSGVGILFEHRLNGEVIKGIDRVQAFGYQLTIHETDHETFALISAIKLPAN